MKNKISCNSSIYLFPRKKPVNACKKRFKFYENSVMIYRSFRNNLKLKINKREIPLT